MTSYFVNTRDTMTARWKRITNFSVIQATRVLTYFTDPEWTGSRNYLRDLENAAYYSFPMSRRIVDLKTLGCDQRALLISILPTLSILMVTVRSSLILALDREFHFYLGDVYDVFGNAGKVFPHVKFVTSSESSH